MTKNDFWDEGERIGYGLHDIRYLIIKIEIMKIGRGFLFS